VRALQTQPWREAGLYEMGNPMSLQLACVRWILYNSRLLCREICVCTGQACRGTVGGAQKAVLENEIMKMLLERQQT